MHSLQVGEHEKHAPCLLSTEFAGHLATHLFIDSLFGSEQLMQAQYGLAVLPVLFEGAL